MTDFDDVLRKFRREMLGPIVGHMSDAELDAWMKPWQKLCDNVEPGYPAWFVKTAHCWSGAEIWCPSCGGATESLEDEYGSLAEGGSYERFRCVEHKGQRCAETIYVELPD